MLQNVQSVRGARVTSRWTWFWGSRNAAFGLERRWRSSSRASADVVPDESHDLNPWTSSRSKVTWPRFGRQGHPRAEHWAVTEIARRASSVAVASHAGQGCGTSRRIQLHAINEAHRHPKGRHKVLFLVKTLRRLSWRLLIHTAHVVYDGA